MKAVEFNTKIINNQIQIPLTIQSEFKSVKDKDIRVIILIDEIEKEDHILFQRTAESQFLKGYAQSDSIYDNYVNE
jgi:hypothetical protein